MGHKDPRSKDFAWTVTCLTVKDIVKAMDFYEKAFGFEKGLTLPGPDGKIMHGNMRYQGKVVLMLAQEGHCDAKSPATAHREPSSGVYVYHHDTDALYLRAVKAGAEVVRPPQDMFWGDRVTNLKDPDGYNWMFGTHLRDFDPSMAPGAK